ncbi:ubiquitin carboxyl-terminal hydrolase 2-like [Clavelina lepadiformis]|uniref:ubiquitin carboxyl-terminal hydrolase 2-like n=1 Tax=Clavelina lepadiformis TaxID=159417 RepID=UPI004041EEF2
MSRYSRHMGSASSDGLSSLSRSKYNYDTKPIYGASANHITSSRYSYSSGLSSPSAMREIRTKDLSRTKNRRITSSNKPLIYDRKKYLTPSMPNKNEEIIRPAMRARGQSPATTRHVAKYSSSPVGSYSSNLTSTSHNNSHTKPLLTSQRRSNSINDSKFLDGSSRYSALSPSSARNTKEEISVDNAPYSKPYSPSFAVKRTPSPKQNILNGRSGYSLSKNQAHQRNDLTGTVGLKNIGNTCFMNCILQCLSHTKDLRDFCLKSKFSNEINSKSPMKGKLIKAFAEVIQQLWENSSSLLSVTPSNFKSQIQKFSPRFMGYEQQDSQEFLRFLLEGLHEDINKIEKKSSEPLPDLPHASPQEKARATWKWYAKKDKSFIFDLFVGQLESSLTCLECGHVSLTYDPFWDLSLPISKQMTYGSETNINDCFQSFTKEESLDRDEKPTCEKCKVRRVMKKKLLIHRFPKILVLHLKRFNEGSRYRQKLTNLVKFPLKSLKLSKYASPTCEDPRSTEYDLYAVSNHCGSCYGGHYTAYCSHNGEWHEFNDSRVTKTSESSICSKEAYVLFYIQKSKCARL